MLQVQPLAEAIAVQWQTIRRALAADREQFEAVLLPLLRALDAESNDHQATIRAILHLFESQPAAHEILRKELQTTTITKGAAVRGGRMGHARYMIVPVFFATDRERAASDDKTYFSGNRGPLTQGVAEVSIHDDHRMGKVERPRWWRLEFREQHARHVIVQSVMEGDLSHFSAQARAQLASSSKQEILLFVHGFNVSFHDAVTRCAQISYDLEFPGLVALYSWPSEASYCDYLVDANNVESSAADFSVFLARLRSELGASVVHVVAHSMGNRLVAGSVGALAASGAGVAQVRHIVFAAPDIDAKTFRNLARTFKGRAERFTLYASSKDKALKLSQALQKYPRAGDAGSGIVIVPDIDTIDASAVETDFVSHSYYGDSKSLLSDLFYLIHHGIGPDHRHALEAASRYGSRYWKFKG